MPLFCAAFGCSNLSSKEVCKRKNITFHSFPLKKPELLKQWLVNIRRQDFVPKQHSRLCSDHFEEGSFAFQPFTNRRCLKADALPTIFNFKPVSKKRKKLMKDKGESSETRIYRPASNSFRRIAPTPATQTQVVSSISDDKPKLYLIRCNPQNGVVVKQLEQDGTQLPAAPSFVESTSEQYDQMPSQSIPCRKRKACENCETAAEQRHREKMQKWDRFLNLMEELVETCKMKNMENLDLKQSYI